MGRSVSYIHTVKGDRNEWYEVWDKIYHKKVEVFDVLNGVHIWDQAMIVGEFNVFIISVSAMRQRLSCEMSYLSNVEVGLVIISDLNKYGNGTES